MKGTKRKWKVILGAVCTGLALWWLMPEINIEKTKTLIEGSDGRWLLLGGVCYISAYIFRTLRFKILLGANAISFKRLFLITGIHNLAVRLLPNPAGEVVFMNQAKKSGVPYASSFAGLVVYRVFDFVAIGLFFGISLIPFVWVLSLQEKILIAASLFAIVFGLVCVIYLKEHREKTRRIISAVSRMVPKVGAKINEKGERVIEAFSLFKGKKIYAKTLISSICVWASMFGAYLFFLKALQIDIKMSHVVLGGAVQVFANVLPNIAGLGIMEAGWVAGLSLAGVPREDAIIGAFGVDAITLLGTLIIGCGALMVRFRMSVKTVGEKTNETVELKSPRIIKT